MKIGIGQRALDGPKLDFEVGVLVADAGAQMP
jgi:hypothetical protein